MSSCYWHSCLVTPKDNWAIHRTQCPWIGTYDLILEWHYQYTCILQMLVTYTMSPSNVPWHYIIPLTLSICTDVDIWAKIELSLKVGIVQHCWHDSIRVAVPDFIVCLHPTRRMFINIFRDCRHHALPGNVAKNRWVNYRVHFLVRPEWGRGIQTIQRTSP